MALNVINETITALGLANYLAQDSCHSKQDCLVFQKGKATLSLSAAESEDLILKVAGLSSYPNVKITYLPDAQTWQDCYWIISSEEEISLEDYMKKL